MENWYKNSADDGNQRRPLYETSYPYSLNDEKGATYGNEKTQ